MEEPQKRYTRRRTWMALRHKADTPPENEETRKPRAMGGTTFAKLEAKTRVKGICPPPRH